MKTTKNILLKLIILLLLIISFSSANFNSYAISKAPERITVTYYNEEVNSRGFNWVTNQSVPESEVQIIKKEGDLTKNNINWDEALKIPGTFNDFYPGHRAWKAHIIDLEYNSTYYFRITAGISSSQVGTQIIKDGLDEVRFIHLTDPQSYSALEYEKWDNTLNIIRRNFPQVNAMLFGGDLTQEYKNEASNIHEWGYAIDGSQSWYLDNVISPSSGNHDKADNMFYNHFNIDVTNNQSTLDGQYYSYEIGNVLVVVLNTNEELSMSTPLSTNQINWIEETLKNSNATWKVVNTHKGFINTGRHMLESDINYLRDDLMPLFAKYEVDLVLQGHDHVYTRSMPYEWSGNGKTTATGYNVIPKIINNNIYDFYENPGTFYVLQNMATARPAALSPIASPYEFPSFFNLENSPVTGKLNNQQPNVPSFGYVTIKDGELFYETYIIDKFTDLVLYDYFAVSKNNYRIVNQKIDKLDEIYHKDNNLKIIDAYNSYQKLSNEEKDLVDANLLTKLMNLEKNIIIDDYNLANQVIQKINKLKRIDFSLEFNENLIDAYDSYHELSNIAKSYVDNYDLLEEAYLKNKNYQDAILIVGLIEELLLLNNPTNNDVGPIRELYNDLDLQTRYYVINYFDLVEVEAKLGLYLPQ